MAIRLMTSGVEQWVWLNDFIGFGLAGVDMGRCGNPRHAYQCLGSYVSSFPTFLSYPSFTLYGLTFNPRPLTLEILTLITFSPLLLPLSDMNPGLALGFIDLMASHYPERLGQLLVLDAPGMMTPLCKCGQRSRSVRLVGISLH